jgi:hypothetical protein
MDWSAVAIPPNLTANKPVDGGLVALALREDPRVQGFCATSQTFKELILREPAPLLPL